MLQRMNFGRLFAVLWLLAASLWAAESRVPVLAELTDGSQVRGTLAPLTLTVESPVLGKMQVSLERVAAVSFDGAQVKLALRNGDRLAGALALPDLRLQTVLGELAVPLARLRQLETLDADGLPTSLQEHLVWHPRFDQAAGQKIPSDAPTAMETEAVKARFIPDQRGRTNAGVLLTNGVARIEARGKPGKPLAKAVTFAGWFKLEGGRLEDTQVCLIMMGSARTPHAGLILDDSEGLQWHGAVDHDSPIQQPFDPIEWTFVAATRDGATLSLYVNGEQVQTQNSDSPPLLGGSDTFVLGEPPAAWGARNGAQADPDEDNKTLPAKIMVGDVRVYSRALNAEEIRRLYQATRK